MAQAALPDLAFPAWESISGEHSEKISHETLQLCGDWGSPRITAPAQTSSGSNGGYAHTWVGWVPLHGLITPSQRSMPWTVDSVSHLGTLTQGHPRQSETLILWSHHQPTFPKGSGSAVRGGRESLLSIRSPHFPPVNCL